MGMLSRQFFPLGWMPNADAVDAPAGSLLRADNLILDEKNILSLRRGSQKIYGPLADIEVHSLHTQSLNGIRYRMVGAGDHVYANGANLGVEMMAPGDTSFGTHMGQIFFARNASKYKYDGTTVRNWGLGMTGGPPLLGSGGGSTNLILDGSSTEVPALEWLDDDGTGASFGASHDGVPNGAAYVYCNPLGAHGQIRKKWATDQDFNNLPELTATDDTEVSVWVYIEDIFQVQGIDLVFSCGDQFETDHFLYGWVGPYYEGGAPNAYQQSVNFTAGWNKLTTTRGTFERIGQTPGRGWNTIRSVHCFVTAITGFTRSATLFDDVRFTGGASSVLNGDYQWVYMLVRDDGSYISESPGSAVSVSSTFTGQAATIVIPQDDNRDPQTTQVWLFRMGGTLDNFYRVKVYQLNPFTTDAITLVDDLSDQDALEIDVVLPIVGLPPNGIIGIEGPYYDRLFALTPTHLYPSMRLMPDNFSPEQVIRISGADETALWVKKAFNGLYIGTTKDVYRLDGTGAEYPDGTLDFTLTPLNIDNPPRNEAVAQEGNQLVYFAADGWRFFQGAGSQLLTGETSLLYRGQDRHGIFAVNTAGRFRAAITRGQLTAITPEGGESGWAVHLYRYTFKDEHWFRFVYKANFRTIYREPDGTLLAGDINGFVWQLDTGNSDDGIPIQVTIWTPRESDGSPFSPKVTVNTSINIDSNGDQFQVALCSDDDGTVRSTYTGATQDLVPSVQNISGEAFDSEFMWRQLQLQITGDFTHFRLSGYAIPYISLPMATKAWDSGPLDLGGNHDIVWLRKLKMKVRAATNLTIRPFFDGIEFDPIPVEINQDANRTTILEATFPRGYFGRVPRLIIYSGSDFYPYWVELHRTGLTQAQSEKPDFRFGCSLGGEVNA